MDDALDERIGDPQLFTGRVRELTYFLRWINDIKEKKSQSTALLSRLKMGKTTLMERLFNITFAKNDGVIPFYYEVKDMKMWAVDFCREFFFTFVFQYIAFKSRKPEYIKLAAMGDFDEANKIAKKEKLDYLCNAIDEVAHAVASERNGLLLNMVRVLPQSIAALRNEFIVQIIDKFNLLNTTVYRDKNLEILQDDLTGGYWSTAESKIAPLLISGGWGGWGTSERPLLLPSRIKCEFLENMPEDESIEMIYKYSHFFDVPVTEETVYMLAELAEGNPSYISSIIHPSLRKKDLTTIDDLIDG